MAYRQDKSLLQRIRKDVKNFNAKRKALFNKGVSPALLPPKVSTKELRAGFTNRRELMDRLKELENFSAAGKVYRSAGGSRGTERLYRYNQNIALKRAGSIDRRAEKLKYSGNTRYPVMLNEAILNMQTKSETLKQDIKILTPDQLRTFLKTSFKPEVQNIRTQQFYDNFYKMMLTEAAQAGFDPDMLIDLLQQFKELTPEELLAAYNANPEFKNIVDYSNTPKRNKGSIIDDESLGDMLETLRNRMPEIIDKIRSEGLR